MCKRCRYDKCLANGMDPKWILSNDEKRIRFKHFFKKKDELASLGLQSGVNFTNILVADFALIGPKSAKQHCWLDCLLFVHSGSAHVNAAHRTLMKLTPGVNFTNILVADFALIGPKSAKQHCWFDCLLFAHSGSAHVKAAHRTLMKLTPGVNFTNILVADFALLYYIYTDLTDARHTACLSFFF